MRKLDSTHAGFNYLHSSFYRTQRRLSAPRKSRASLSIEHPASSYAHGRCWHGCSRHSNAPVQAHPYRGGVVRTIAVAGRAGYVLRCPPTTWNVMDR